MKDKANYRKFNFNSINKKLYSFLVLIILAIATTIGAYAFSFRNMTLDFVHISDTHITSRADTSYKALGSSKELLKDAVEQINDIIGLDFVFFGGDMVDSASEENFYDFYSIISKLKYPSLNAFGNHEYYGEMGEDEVLSTVKRYNPNYIFNKTYYALSPKTDYRIVVLNATDRQGATSGGHFDKEQLDFLDNELANNQDKVVVIALHHPPLEPFVAKEHSIDNKDEFFNILLKYKNPIVVLTGHYHATKLRIIGNLVFVSTPAMVTYPMAFRHIKITNYKDRVIYNFDFIPTRLDEVKEQNRQNVISYATLAGSEKDRNYQYIYHKKHPKSARYKKNKIQDAAKETRASKREIKKLTNPKQTKKEKVKKEKVKKIKKSKKAKEIQETSPQEL